ncbi:MAG: molybdenum cofactor biosynthesis protein MoaE [Rhodothermales bacterium]|nr:molybdenum cofactor biosynthesis protein MoaE [Rhodothermales bacterium]
MMNDPDSGRVDVILSREALSVDVAHESVMRGNVGAVSVFVGTTRAFTEGKGETSQLEYDCYEDMAVAEMKRISRVAVDRWSAERVYIAHRLGVVPVSEASVIIAVSSAHRSEAIEACRYLIDTLKQTVPIWKKEVYSDGTTEWVEGTSFGAT